RGTRIDDTRDVFCAKRVFEAVAGSADHPADHQPRDEGRAEQPEAEHDLGPALGTVPTKLLQDVVSRFHGVYALKRSARRGRFAVQSSSRCAASASERSLSSGTAVVSQSSGRHAGPMT